MQTAEFLLEIGVEEIPDWMIEPALADLKRRFLEALESFSLRPASEPVLDATPRRLVLMAGQLPARQEDRDETLAGPPRKIAFDDKGNPTKAAIGFAQRAGVAVEDLKTGEDGRLSVTRHIAGRATKDILSEVLPALIEGIHFPKTMYWTGKSGPRFIRPIRWLVALFGGEAVAFEIAGVRSGNKTEGHRRLGKAAQQSRDRKGAVASQVSPIAVTGWQDYQQKLRENGVLVRAEDRRRRIEEQSSALMSGGRRVRSNPRLLHTLTYLTEHPTPLLGVFDPSYLSLPEEVLETVMLHHQRYFAVEEENGKLAPAFVAVSNLDGDPEGIIRRGHERVLRARFNDAQFFWSNDQKQKLGERVERLRGVTFQAKLGTYFDKTERNERLTAELASAISLTAEDAAYAQRAAQLAKCDLTTELVGEFPELQGAVGGLYARHQGEPLEVADAIYDHYQPAGAEDRIPRGTIAQIVALADKLDTLGGFFRLAMIPSGSRDPFALRRAAFGIIRILIEGGHALAISKLSEWAGAGENRAALREFLLDRLRYYLRDVRGHRYDEVNAVLSASGDVPLDAAERAQAISKVRPTPDFEPLAVSFKRIKNILEQAGGVDTFAAGPVEEGLLEPGAEQQLYAAFARVRSKVSGHKHNGSYADALAAIASLRPAVDKFFDDVLVNAKDEKIRRNRLTFLAQLLREFSTIADFAEIVSA
jgi:glycyl-tRNA synthetase beta chain